MSCPGWCSRVLRLALMARWQLFPPWRLSPGPQAQCRQQLGGYAGSRPWPGLVPALPFTWAGFPAPPLPGWGASPLWASVSSFVQKGNQGTVGGAPPPRSHSSMPRAGRWERWWFPPPGEGTPLPSARQTTCLFSLGASPALSLWAGHHELCLDSQGAAGHFQWDTDGKQRGEVPKEEFEVNPLHQWGPASQTEARAQLCGVGAVGALRAGNRLDCVWLATDEKLGDPSKTALALLGSMPKPTISKMFVLCVWNYSLQAPAQRQRHKPGSGEAGGQSCHRSCCGRGGAPLNTLSRPPGSPPALPHTPA